MISKNGLIEERRRYSDPRRSPESTDRDVHAILGAGDAGSAEQYTSAPEDEESATKKLHSSSMRDWSEKND
jgi:hypothetical protein